MNKLLLTALFALMLPLAAQACDPIATHCNNTTVTNPDGAIVATTYSYDSHGVNVGSGITITALKHNGTRTAATTYYDSHGKTISMATTNYDSRGKLVSTTTTNPDKSSFTINYDSAGNMVSTVNIDSGNEIAVAYFDPRYNSATAAYDDTGYTNAVMMAAKAPGGTESSGKPETILTSGVDIADNSIKTIVNKTTGKASLAVTALGMGILVRKKPRRVSFAVVTGVALILL